MAKLIAPLFSVQAHGSIGRRLTFQSRPRLHIARSIPHYPPTYSYAQLRQRWLYRMGIALWNGMSASDKAVYTSLAKATNTTGMNIWLREWLNDRPNLSLALPVVWRSGTTLYDIGPNNWNPTLVGPSWVGTTPDPAVLADGLDDYAQFSPSSQMDITVDSWSIALAFTFQSIAGGQRVFDKLGTTNSGYMLRTIGGNTFDVITGGGASQTNQAANANVLILNQPHIMVVTQTGTTVKIFIDGVDQTAAPVVMNTPATTANLLSLFARTTTHILLAAMTLYWLAAFDRSLSEDEAIAIGRTFAFVTP